MQTRPYSEGNGEKVKLLAPLGLPAALRSRVPVWGTVLYRYGFGYGFGYGTMKQAFHQLRYQHQDQDREWERTGFNSNADVLSCIAQAQLRAAKGVSRSARDDARRGQTWVSGSWNQSGIGSTSEQYQWSAWSRVEWIISLELPRSRLNYLSRSRSSACDAAMR